MNAVSADQPPADIPKLHNVEASSLTRSFQLLLLQLHENKWRDIKECSHRPDQTSFWITREAVTVVWLYKALDRPNVCPGLVSDVSGIAKQSQPIHAWRPKDLPHKRRFKLATLHNIAQHCTTCKTSVVHPDLAVVSKLTLGFGV
jgi:hypothetical protein